MWWLGNFWQLSDLWWKCWYLSPGVQPDWKQKWTRFSSFILQSKHATEKEDDSSVLVYTPNASEETNSSIVAYTPSSQNDSSHWQFLVDFLATQKVGERFSVSGAAICKKAFSMILGCSSRRIDWMISVAQKGQVRLVHGNAALFEVQRRRLMRRLGWKYFLTVSENTCHTRNQHIYRASWQERMGARADPDLKKTKQEHLKWLSDCISSMCVHSACIASWTLAMCIWPVFFLIANCVSIHFKCNSLVQGKEESIIIATQNPYRILTSTRVIIDGMDQTKPRLPLTRKIAKSTQSLYHLSNHITGSLEHTRTSHGKRAYITLTFYNGLMTVTLSSVLNHVLLDQIGIHQSTQSSIRTGEMRRR